MQDSSDTVRETLDVLIRARGLSYAGVSSLLGKNAAYIQQFIKRGSPKKLDEDDRRLLAEFFGVAESALGGPVSDLPVAKKTVRDVPDAIYAPRQSPRLYPRSKGSLRLVPRMAIGASAGAGALNYDEMPLGQIAFDEGWLRQLGVGSSAVTMIQVEGDSMVPSLGDGDDILVAMMDDAGHNARDGIYVLRMDDALMVKRVSFRPNGHLSIKSDNKLYASYDDVAPDQVAIVGRVVWAGRRI